MLIYGNLRVAEARHNRWRRINLKLILTTKGVPELRGPALVCLSALHKKLTSYFVNIAVLVFLMGQNPKCPGYNY